MTAAVEQGRSRPGAMRLGLSFGLVLLLMFSTQVRAHALDPGGFGPVAKVLFPASAGAAGAGAAAGTGAGAGAAAGSGAAGTVWTAGATGGAAAGAVGVLPLAAGIAAAVVVGGAFYVGYRHFSGDPIDWWWSDGYSDPSADPGGDFVGTDATVTYYGETAPSTFGTSAVRHFLDLTRHVQSSVAVRAHCPPRADGTVTTDTAPTGWEVSPWLVQCGYTSASERNEYGMQPIAKVEVYLDGQWTDIPQVEGGTMFPAGVAATLKVELDCENVSTGVVTTRTFVSDSYTDPSAPPAFPAAECLEGELIVDVKLLREAPNVDPLRIDDPSQPLILPQAVPAPSYVPTEQEDLWDACQDGSCELEVWEKDGSGQPTRKLAPPGDMGWQTRPDRELVFECFWVSPTGDMLGLPLWECYNLQWEPVDVPGVGITPGQPVTLSPPVAPPTLSPPTAPLSASRCDAMGSESGFLGSMIIMRGVVCALEWAFAPNTVGTQLEALREDANARPPFSVVGPVSEGVAALGDLGDEEVDCGVLQSFYPYVDNTDQLQDQESFDERGSLPCAPAMNHVWQTVYGMVSLVIAATGVMSMFLLTSRALKGP